MLLLLLLGRQHPEPEPDETEDEPMPNEAPTETPPRTEHFDVSEWRDKRADRDVPRAYWGNVQRLMHALEAVRAELGGVPIHIASGWRSPETNAAVGGARKSQHKVGNAADIFVPGRTVAEIFEVVDRLQRSGQIPRGGASAYKNFVHVDVRGKLARW